MRRPPAEVAAAIVATTVVVVGAVLLVRACDGGSDPSTSTTTVTAPLTTAPLTGLRTDQPIRPALMVKLDNVDAARPQDGLFAADVIFEELVEGGLTRLGAVYSSVNPELVGPIRSVRETDLHVAALLGRPALVFSGGAEPVLARVARAEEAETLVPISPATSPDVFFRRRDRVAPHDLYATADDLWAVAGGASPPDVLFSFGPAAPALPVGGFSVSFPSTRVDYRWQLETRRWLRSQNGSDQVDASRPDEPFGTDNVVVLVVTYRPSLTNELSPELDLGEGPAWVYRDGGVSACRWSISSRPGPRFELRDAQGAVCALTPGRTLVELAPSAPT